MNKRTSILLLCAVLFALLGGSFFLYNRYAAELAPQNLATAPQETETPGDIIPSEEASQDSPPAEEAKSFAPDFTVLDADGNEVTLSQQRGKPVVLNFWASWCSPCKSEMPDFESAYQTYGEEITFMMVNLTDGSRETMDGAAAFIAAQGYTFPIYFDTTYSAAMAYGTSSIPVTFFIDAEGYPVAYGQGALHAETLQRGIDMILN